jgi:hypothetical protein
MEKEKIEKLKAAVNEFGEGLELVGKDAVLVLVTNGEEFINLVGGSNKPLLSLIVAKMKSNKDFCKLLKFSVEFYEITQKQTNERHEN